MRCEHVVDGHRRRVGDGASDVRPADPRGGLDVEVDAESILDAVDDGGTALLAVGL